MMNPKHFAGVTKLVGAVACTFLCLINPQVSAQHVRHLQQVYDVLPGDEMIRTSVTKALTPVKQNTSKSLHWAFASTVVMNDTGSTDGGSNLHTLLVKLQANQPHNQAFGFEWARFYEAFTYDTTNEPIPIYLDVEDVYHEAFDDNFGYILCGQATQGDSTNGFLLRTNDDGIVINAKIFRDVHNLKSVVPWQKSGKGYIAVGETTRGPDNNGRSAVYMSVTKDLDDVVCALKMDGVFNQQQPKPIESGLNKVIPYSKSFKNEPSYAIVGQTIKDYQNKCKKKQDSTVIVGIINERCQPKYVYRYGDKKKRFKERGLSIAQVSKKGQLAVTGNVQKFKNNCKIKSDDILAFQLKVSGAIRWWRYYDVKGKRDFGTAIQLSSYNSSSILIAGETQTPYLEEGSSDNQFGKDAFLLEVDKQNGAQTRFEVFGLELGTDNGALNYGKDVTGNIDLHLTRDKNAVVMMGNTEYPNFLPNNSKKKYPYLVERYETIEEVCVDMETEIKKRTYKIKVNKVTIDKIDVKPEKIRVNTIKQDVKHKVPCPKETRQPTDSPSAAPTAFPTDYPTNEPTRFSPTSTPTKFEPTTADTPAPTKPPVPTYTLGPKPTPAPILTEPPVQKLTKGPIQSAPVQLATPNPNPAPISKPPAQPILSNDNKN